MWQKWSIADACSWGKSHLWFFGANFIPTCAINQLEHMYPAKAGRKDVATYLDAVARLGGYLARQGDSPPGNMVLWRGFSRLTGIHLGFVLARVVGN
jgi:hypothetical protein